MNGSDAAVSAASVLLVDGTQLRRRIRLLGQDGACHRLDVFLSVLRILEKGRGPGIPPDSSASDEDRGGGKLAWEVV